jgi:hypothetical protein
LRPRRSRRPENKLVCWFCKDAGQAFSVFRFPIARFTASLNAHGHKASSFPVVLLQYDSVIPPFLSSTPHVKLILPGWQAAQVHLHMKDWFAVFNSNGLRSGGEHLSVALHRHIIRAGRISPCKLNGEIPPPARDDRRRNRRSARFSTEQKLIADIDSVRLISLGRICPLRMNP